MPSWKKVITSGSDAELNSLYAPSITGSLHGTASYAVTASYVNPLQQTVLVTGSLIISSSNNTNDFQVGTNKLFVSASGNVGIGTTTPTRLLQVENSQSILFFDPTSAGGDLRITGSTGVPRMSIAIPASASRPLTGFQLGMRTWGDTSFTGYGKIGDSFFYAGNETNGFNILNPTGTGTEDYIRFYAGQLATDTADIHIQGTGSTRGNVGIGKETPNTKLDILGNTTITGSLKITGSGYINGLPILTSANTSSFLDGFGWYGVFCSTGSQTNPVANVSRSMQLDTTEHSNGVSFVSGSRITFAHAGVYNIQFSAQLESTSAGDKDVNIWFKKNGTNIARSNTLINVAKQSGDKIVAAWNYVDTANVNDYIEIMWQASDTTIQLLAATATGNIPSTPSVIVTATQVG